MIGPSGNKDAGYERGSTKELNTVSEFSIQLTEKIMKIVFWKCKMGNIIIPKTESQILIKN